MKKILAIVLCLILILPITLSVAYAENELSCYDIMVDFVTKHPHRQSGTGRQREGGEYIKNFFNSVGYDTVEQDFEYDITSSYYGAGEPIKDKNYIAKLDSESTRTVVIGAHYDNAFSSGNGQGAYDNGSGIGILLALSKALKGETLDYDIEFIAFGGEEDGLFGSRYYVQNLSASQKDNLILYINLDSIFAGDEVYMYADEVKTYHEEYFLSVATNVGAKINPYPEYKGVAGVYNFGDKLPYTHVGLSSDNASFFNAGIMSVSFSSFNIKKQSLEQVNESLTYDNVMHKSDDNIAWIESVYGDSAKQKMESVYSVVYTALINENFIESMIYARANNFNYTEIINGKVGTVISLIAIGLLIVLVVISCKVFNKKAQNQPKSDNNNFTPPEVFSDF